MEINKAPAEIHSYWPRYISRTIFFVITMQVIGILVIGSALLLFHIADGSELLFWVSLGAVLVSTVSINIIMTNIITEPIKLLTAALAKSQGEQSPLVPPNPNTTRYEKNGLRPLLQAIYERSGGQTATVEQADHSDLTYEALNDALSGITPGIMMFDEAHNLVFSNSSAPIIENPDGSKSPDLLFYTDTSFEEWRDACEKNAVHAEKSWARIASKPVGEEGRKLYDISASYRKDSSVPIVLVLFDKTNEYAPEDDDLNFIAFAAHELRGPITVIRGYLDTLQDELETVTDAEQKELFQRLIVSANRLSSYINNILNSSRYDRRHLSVRLTENSIHDIYAMIADDMQLRASSQNRLLFVDLPATLPKIAADSTSLSEVIGNLIDNAIKYSNEGGSISVYAEQQGDTLEVYVKDQGIGMPANVVGNLFHKFYRSHRSRETVAGTGIGLYISKAIVESHGGTMQVQSVEGEGSTFSFSVPLYAAVADKLAKDQDSAGMNNQELITNHSGGWIKNHGIIRG